MTSIQIAKSGVRRREDCRLCGSKRLKAVISLAPTPPANEFVTADERSQPQDLFPLTVHLCASCGHAQLLDVVDPERLFRGYVYVSGTSPVFIDHFRRYAESMQRMMQLLAGSRVVEIGSNDGTLLRFFKQAGMSVLGIDPARQTAEEATRSGIDTLPEFFDLELARRLRAERGGASLILANNVFAHADDLHSIADGVAHLLEPDGLFVFEVSYVVDVIEKTLFDTIYHEHLSYHAVKPLVEFFARHGLQLVDAMRVDTHGGSLRGIVKRAGAPWPLKASVAELILYEARMGLHSPDAFRTLFATIQRRKAELMELVIRLKRDGKRIIGFGAPAKATTLMHYFGLGSDTIDYLVDDSPRKQGMFSPGHHIPVVASTALYDRATRPDYALVLAWNFAESIIANHRRFLDAGGHFIIPLPTLQIR